MPRAERLKSDSAKKLLQISKDPTQTTIGGFFKKVAGDSSEGRESTAESSSSSGDVQGQPRSPNPVQGVTEKSVTGQTNPNPLAICDNWIKVDSDFSAEEKHRSENKGRFFQVEWFQSEKHAAFCGVCTQFKQPRDVSPFIFEETATGFRNWKKGKERLNEHEISNVHRIAASSAIKSQSRIDCQLDKQIDEQQRLRREGLVAHLSTLETLL